MNHSIENFVQIINKSIENKSFIKITLSKSTNKEDDLINIYGRIIYLKEKPAFSCTLRYKTKDETKNFEIPEALFQLKKWIGNNFLNVDLFTTDGDFTLVFNKKRISTILQKKASQTVKEQPKTHNRVKNRILEAKNQHYLQALDISDANGNVLKNAQKKYKQISRYIEIIDSLLQEQPLRNDAEIVDMGSGKGYLTFALYDYLSSIKEMCPRLTGIELRQNLVDFCNDLSTKNNFSGLHFEAADINTFQTTKLDMLIALHACDTATDLAIAKGIAANATIIIVAPCCHKQVRKAMDCTSEMSALMHYGILEERQAELLTDGIRALLLESKGYHTKVFEFVGTEDTPKNIMITGVKTNKPNKKALLQIAAIKEHFGIKSHYLEQLLNN